MFGKKVFLFFSFGFEISVKFWIGLMLIFKFCGTFFWLIFAHFQNYSQETAQNFDNVFYKSALELFLHNYTRKPYHFRKSIIIEVSNCSTLFRSRRRLRYRKQGHSGTDGEKLCCGSAFSFHADQDAPFILISILHSNT
jgi:hypothetical protein